MEVSHWDTLSSKTSTSQGHQLDGDEIVNAPLSCYIVKWRNKKVAIKGLVQLSNLSSSYNGNKMSLWWEEAIMVKLLTVKHKRHGFSS